MGCIHVGVPAGDRPIFSRKNELACEGLPVFTDDKVDRTVENVASWCCGFYTCRSRDGDCWWDLLAGTGILRGEARAIV